MRNRRCRYDELNANIRDCARKRLVVVSPSPKLVALLEEKNRQRVSFSLSIFSFSLFFQLPTPLPTPLRRGVVSFFNPDQDLPLRDRRQGWKHEGQGAPRGRGSSCCVSNFQLILSGRSTCSTLSGASSPWWHDPDKFSYRLSTQWPDNGDVILEIKWDEIN